MLFLHNQYEFVLLRMRIKNCFETKSSFRKKRRVRGAAALIAMPPVSRPPSSTTLAPLAAVRLTTCSAQPALRASRHCRFL